MNIFTQIKLIFAAITAVWPTVDMLVQQVESAFPAGTPGATKLAQVKAFLDAAWAQVSGVEVTLEQVWPYLSTMITALVALYHSLGTFNKQSST